MDDRTDRAPTNAADAARPPDQTLVIIGNGMMSWKLCQKLVECGANQVIEIVVFGEEPRPAYDRVHLTELLSGKEPDDLTLAPETWYEDNGIELYLGDPVVEIDREDCVVRSAKGREVPYDRLVFATGSRPFVPPIPGADLPGVFVYRTVDHIDEIKKYSESLACAAVIGGGLLGLEAAKAVYDLGLEVHVIEFGPGLMNRQLDPKGSGLLKEKIEDLGVKVHLSRQTTKIEDAPPGAHAPGKPARILHFADGATLPPVDMVILSAGIRPRGELAGAAGIELAKNGGIMVDDHLATSDPRVFAVGECAVHRGTTYGLAFPGYKMVEILVDNLVGGNAAFEGADQSAKLKLMGVTVASMGQFNESDAPNSSVALYTGKGERTPEQVYRKLVIRDGRIVGCIAIGEWGDLDRVRDAIEQPRHVTIWSRFFADFDVRRFKSTGSLFRKSESQPVTEWAAEALVCGCLRINRGTLSQAQMDGCSTVEELCARTGAGTMCGSCKPLLAELLGGSRDSVPPSLRSDAAPASMRSPPVSRRSLLPARPSVTGGAPLSARDAAPASRRKSVAPPPYDSVTFTRHTPTPVLPVMRTSSPTPVVAAPAPAPVESVAPGSEDGPLSRRGSMLPPVPARRSLRPSAPSVRVESAAPLPASAAPPLPPLRREVEVSEATAVPTSTRVSFRPPERISFTQADPLDDDEPAPISVRVPATSTISTRPPSTSPRPLSASQRPPSTSRRLSIGPVEVRAMNDASAARDSILPPAPDGTGDSMIPPPDSSSPPPSLRDFLPPSVRDAASLQLRDAGSKLMREAAAVAREAREHDNESRESVRGRDLRSREASRSRDAARSRDQATASSGRGGEARTQRDSDPVSSGPYRTRDSVPPPSRRRDSLPPLRPISVPPVRGSVAPGRISSAGRVSSPSLMPPPERGGRLLLSASLGAFLAALAVPWLGPIPTANTTRGLHLDALWTSNAGKQATGYAVVALALASLLLSLRKRWKGFTYSEVPIFRAVHATLGALTLVVLVLHTGLHLGRNLNRMLMIDFLALALLGAVAGAITAQSHWFSRPITARNQRLLWFRAHLILFWPLPVLLALHILGAYYY